MFEIKVIDSNMNCILNHVLTLHDEPFFDKPEKV